MMTKWVRAWRKVGQGAIYALALGTAAPAVAQSQGDPNSFRLDPETPAQAPSRTQGPADPERPGSQPQAPDTTPPVTQAPQPTPAPSASTPAAPPPAVSQPRAQTPAPAATPRAQQPDERPASIATPETAEETPGATASPEIDEPVAMQSADPIAAATEGTTETSATEAAATESTDAGGPSWLWLLALIPLAGVAAFIWRRKRSRDAAPDWAEETPAEPAAEAAAETQAEPAAPVAVPASPAPVVAPPPPAPEVQPPARTLPAGTITSRRLSQPAPPAPAASNTPRGAETPQVEIVFEAESASQTLRFANVRFRAQIRNVGAIEVEPLVFDATLLEGGPGIEQAIGGFARAPGQDGQRIAGLRPGELAEFSGELRLPLSDVTPMKMGERLLLVPVAALLARYAWRDSGVQRQGFALASFVVGVESVPPGEKMGPFRLDLGPRTLDRIGQRPGRIALAA